MIELLTYQYGNITLSYRRSGTGKPLLMLHGWGSSGELMMPLAKNLTDLRTCYVVDLPGFGQSDPPTEPWSVDDYADFILRFVRDLELNRIDLLVHSFGGRIALKLAAREDAESFIDKILITAGAGMKPRRNFSYIMKKYTAKLLKAPFLLLPKNTKEKALARLRETKLWKSLGSSDYRRLTGVMRETFVKTVNEYLESCLPEIENEVLLLWGDEDQATPLYQGRRMEEGIENAALVVIENAGHYAFLDQPARFASIARAFFKG
ncbi:MAG: alpha/beta hydrolase [Balneolaceae bacterium]|nr:alpha/beta hydrolase [Balneolaceae bacterium]